MNPEYVLDVLFQAGEFEDFSMDLSRFSGTLCALLVDDVDEDVIEFVREVLDISADMHEAITLKKLRETADLFPNAENQARIVFELQRAFIMDTLPLFEAYVQRMKEAETDA